MIRGTLALIALGALVSDAVVTRSTKDVVKEDGKPDTFYARDTLRLDDQSLLNCHVEVAYQDADKDATVVDPAQVPTFVMLAASEASNADDEITRTITTATSTVTATFKQIRG